MIVGDRGTAFVAREVDGLLRGLGQSVGLAIRGHAFVNGTRRDLDTGRPSRALRTLLRDPEVEALVCTLPPSRLVGRGLILDRVDVAAVTSPAKRFDHATYEPALEILYRAAPSCLVVSEEHPLLTRMEIRIGSGRLLLTSWNGLTRSVRRHLERGGRAVIAKWRQGRRYIEIYEGSRIVASHPIVARAHAEQIPQSARQFDRRTTGPRSHRIEPRLFAAGLAVGLGEPADRTLAALTMV